MPVSTAIAAFFGWPDVLTLPLACQYAQRSRWTLMRAVQRGELAVAGRRGRSPCFRRADLGAFLLGQTRQATADERTPSPAASSAPARFRHRGSLDAIARLRKISKAGR